MGRFRDAFLTLLRPGWDAELQRLRSDFRILNLEVNATLDKLQHQVWRDTKRRTRALDESLTLDEPAEVKVTKPGTHRGAIAARVRGQLAVTQRRELSDEPTDAASGSQG